MRFLVIVLCLPFILNGQSYDVGLGVGGAIYNGDLSVMNSDYLIDHSHGAIYLNAAYHLNDVVSFRAGLLATNLSADDALASDQWQIDRNLNFRTSLYEFSLKTEINIKNLFGQFDPISMPYVFFGASAFKFNPKAEYNGQFIDLQPLGTEGQGMVGYDDKYDLYSVSVLFGLGYKYKLRNGIVISASFEWHRAATDYIDDISLNYISNEELFNHQGLLASNLGNKIGKSTGSQRGGKYSNDWYNVGLVSINYIIDDKKNGRRIGSRGSRVGCPSSF